jgi:hydroxylamine reductase
MHNLKAIAVYGKLLCDLGVRQRPVDLFIIEGLFTTVTNVNFSPQHLASIIYKAAQIKEELAHKFLEEYKKKNNKDFAGKLPEIVNFKPAKTLKDLLGQEKDTSLLAQKLDEDTRSLREILLYGLKGMSAYADHAAILGKEDEGVNSFFYKGLAALTDNSLSTNDYLALIMEFGQVNLRCMEILDQAHTEHFGNPIPTKVVLGVKKGPAIIVSGHDLSDLKQLLLQTEGTGISVYTHGEMLPAHGYPGLKKHPHLVGHFGSAWQNQQKEFANIPAAILMTTNCLKEPQPSYHDRLFTTGLVAWDGLEHIPAKGGKKDFRRVIEKAKALGGFKKDEIEKEILVGFAHHTVLSLADKVIEAVKAKKVRHFFLIGGCDGAKPGRNYYTEFAQKAPKDCLILTLACGKFRFNRLDFGYIGDLPRLLDCGQCNDAYSAIKIASALAKAFGCSINDLPLSLVLSWYEQKAVCILLTLLSLGIKNIRLGPSLPAFISPKVLNILAEKFNLKPISTVDNDLKEILPK